ncbi:MAG: ribonuclease HI [Clostridiales bacterium]|jgi:ribonuclease HI|nr:ribonuclease HI [Clostridiales bacterium]
MNLKKVSIYTDGACSGNPGPGGWGTILMYKKNKKELSGGEAMTTNNRMELMAVIAGLEALKEPCDVTVFSDSKYIVDSINLGWAEKWQKNDWMKSKKEKAKNHELWERLFKAMEPHKVEFVWVKGHAENEFNNRCDKIAVEQSKSFLN